MYCCRSTLDTSVYKWNVLLNVYVAYIISSIYFFKHLIPIQFPVIYVLCCTWFLLCYVVMFRYILCLIVVLSPYLNIWADLNNMSTFVNQYNYHLKITLNWTPIRSPCYTTSFIQCVIQQTFNYIFTLPKIMFYHNKIIS